MDDKSEKRMRLGAKIIAAGAAIGAMCAPILSFAYDFPSVTAPTAETGAIATVLSFAAKLPQYALDLITHNLALALAFGFVAVGLIAWKMFKGKIMGAHH